MDEKEEIERDADVIEKWLLDSEREGVSASNIQRVLRIGLIRANMIIEQLVKRVVIKYDSKTGKYEVIRK